MGEHTICSTEKCKFPLSAYEIVCAYVQFMCVFSHELLRLECISFCSCLPNSSARYPKFRTLEPIPFSYFRCAVSFYFSSTKNAQTFILYIPAQARFMSLQHFLFLLRFVSVCCYLVSCIILISYDRSLWETMWLKHKLLYVANVNEVVEWMEGGKCKDNPRKKRMKR